MAEMSYWWTTGGATGDQVASYTQAHLATIAQILATCSGRQGVAPGFLSELALSTPGGLVTRIASGGALVDGKPYYNDSNLDLTHDATPSQRKDYVVLDCNWAQFNVSAAIVKGTDGTLTLPSLTNTPGTRVQLAMAEVTISSGGTVSHVDVRPWAQEAFLYRRLGGSATAWFTGGTTEYTPGKHRVFAGAGQTVGGSQTLTFPVAFSGTPLVLVTSKFAGYIMSVNVSASQVTVNCRLHDGTTVDSGYTWLAIGPE